MHWSLGARLEETESLGAQLTWLAGAWGWLRHAERRAPRARARAPQGLSLVERRQPQCKARLVLQTEEALIAEMSSVTVLASNLDDKNEDADEDRTRDEEQQRGGLHSGQKQQRP